MIIRRAVPEDYKALMALYADFLERDFSKPGNDSFQKVLASKTNYILVAEDDSRLAGFITASVRPIVRYVRPIMQVDELYVDPDFREHGVGRQLIQGIESLGADNNCHAIYIESGQEYTVAHKFYERNSYQKVGYYFKKVL